MAVLAPIAKKCGDCGRVRPTHEFVKRARARDGLYSYCKECHARHQRERAEANPEREREKRQEAKARVYGLTAAEYEAIIGRGCAICGTHTVRLGVDHDHTNGEVRDALCIKCNAALGQMDDDPRRLREAADYLERHR